MADRKQQAVAWRPALAAAGQWRLLVLWLAGLLVPTLIAAVPVWRALGRLLDHSVHAQAWAAHLDALMLIDAVAALTPNAPVLRGDAVLAFLVLLALLPFLNAMVVGSALAGRRLSFGHLLQCGVVEYAPMARLLLCSILVYALAALPVAGAFALASGVAERAVLEASADRAFAAAVAVLVVFFLVAQLVVEGARAAFMADAGLRSAVRALGRSVRVACRRPLASLGCFLGLTAGGYLLAFILGVVRTALPRGNWLEWGIAFALTELIALAFVYMHVARLYALRAVALAAPPRAAGAPPPDAAEKAPRGSRPAAERPA